MKMKQWLRKITVFVICLSLAVSGSAFIDMAAGHAVKAAALTPTLESSTQMDKGETAADFSDKKGFGITEALEPSEPSEEQEELVQSSVPMDVSIGAQSADEIILKWSAENKAAYKICRSVSNQPYVQVGTVEAESETVSYTDTDVVPGVIYRYILLENQNGILTEESDVKSCMTCLDSPNGLSVKAVDNKSVEVSWKQSEYASGYYVYRSNHKTSGYTKIASVSNTVSAYTDKTLINGKPYYYKVQAYLQDNELANSKMQECVAYYMKPAAPVVNGEAQKKEIRLSWARPTGGEVFYVYRENTKGVYEQIGSATGLSFYDKNVDAGKTYNYKVRAAYIRDGKTITSDFSSVISVYASGIDPNKPMIALTFDDGPGPYTQAIVDCLEKNNARATFFVVGNRVKSYKSSLKSAFDIGCEIGNHTWSHPTLTKLSSSAVRTQINDTDSVVKSITGAAPKIYRAPGGATNKTVRSLIAKPHIYWSIDTLDWKTRSKQKTINSVLNNVKDGDIILMHDIHKPTMQAALYLIPELKRRGYQLVTVSELARYKGVEMKNGVTYYSFR